MSILVWVIFGGIAGWLASMVAGTNKSQGLLGNIVVGVLGAFVGGWIMSMLGYGTVTEFNLYGLLVAVAGAVLLLFLWKVVSGRREV